MHITNHVLFVLAAADTNPAAPAPTPAPGVWQANALWLLLLAASFVIMTLMLLGPTPRPDSEWD